MKLKLYAIKDELTEFAPVTTLTNDTVARRWFEVQQHDIPSIKYKPEDYSLWALGEYDSKKGIIKAYDAPELLERGQRNGEIKETV